MLALNSADSSEQGPVRMSKSDRQLESTSMVAGEPEDAPPIDIAHLRRYTFGDEKLEREVLELFVVHAPGIVREIKSAACEESLRQAAHGLKGSALAVGAWEVARRAEQAEAAAASYGEVGELVEMLEAAVERVRRYIAARHRRA